MITIDDTNLQLSEDQEKMIRLEIAVMLFEKADFSFYVAAKFAEMHWMDFVRESGKRELSIFDENYVLRDIENTGKHAKNNN